jgi:hypothetical protein
MMRRMLLAAMLICLIVGLAQARSNQDSKAVAPPSSDSNGLDMPFTFMRHDPLDRGIPNGIGPVGVSQPDFTREPAMPPTFRLHEPIDGGIPQGYDPIIWGVWMLMKSFGGGN